MTASKDEDPDTGLSAHEDAALARMYRHGAPRSPAALDEAVLAHAEEALAASRRRRQQRLRYWSLAASFTLVTGLVWQLREEVVPKPSRPAAPPPSPALPDKTPNAGHVPKPSAIAPPPAQRPQGQRLESRAAATARLSTPETDQTTAQGKADAGTVPMHDGTHDTASAQAEQTAGKEENRAAQPASTGSIAAAVAPPAETLAAAPISADTAAPAASRPEPVAAATTDVKVQQLLQSIRALPGGSSFVAPGSGETLKPAAFAERMASAASVEALLKAATGWQLTQPDGSTVAADRWLRDLSTKP